MAKLAESATAETTRAGRPEASPSQLLRRLVLRIGRPDWVRLRWAAVFLPAAFVAVFELLRHSYFDHIAGLPVESVAVFLVVLSASFIFSRGVFGVVQRLQQEIVERNRDLAILEERERIAREMHDGLAQVLGYVSTKTQAARTLLASNQTAAAAEQIEELERAAQNVYADVREAILGLRTAVTPEKGFIETLREFTRQFSMQSHIKTELVVPTDASRLLFRPTDEIQIIRIIQEALTNARKHAGASRAWVRLESNDDGAVVTIEDNGRGFRPDQVSREGGRPRFGLQTMRERAESLGGQLEINSAPGAGTRVIVRVPNREEATP